MGGKYSILAKNYQNDYWSVGTYTNNLFKAMYIWVRASFKYELVEFTIRK
jgi:hypothetical protein